MTNFIAFTHHALQAKSADSLESSIKHVIIMIFLVKLISWPPYIVDQPLLFLYVLIFFPT